MSSGKSKPDLENALLKCAIAGSISLGLFCAFVWAAVKTLQLVGAL